MIIFLKRAVVFILLFLMLFSIAFLMIQHYYIKKSKIVVSREIPNDFPIAIFLSDTASHEYQIQHVYYHNLEEFRRSHKYNSFLVPEEYLEQFKNEDTLVWKFQNRSKSLQWHSEKPYHAALLIEDESVSSQNIKFTCTWDNDFINIGWYSATDQKIIPRYYQHYYVQGMILYGISWAFLISAMIMFITSISIKKIRNRFS